MRVLLVEDEPIVAMMVEDMLTDIGIETVQTASDLASACKAAEDGRFDFAILDLSLGGVMTYPTAAILKDKGTPFAFATGYGSGALEPAYAATPVLQKPFQIKDLEKVVAALTS